MKWSRFAIYHNYRVCYTLWGVCGTMRIWKYMERLWSIEDMEICGAFVEHSGYEEMWSVCGTYNFDCCYW